MSVIEAIGWFYSGRLLFCLTLWLWRGAGILWERIRTPATQIGDFK